MTSNEWAGRAWRLFDFVGCYQARGCEREVGFGVAGVVGGAEGWLRSVGGFMCLCKFGELLDAKLKRFQVVS